MMLQETGLMGKNSSVIADRLKHLSVLLIVSLILATLVGMYVSGAESFDVRNCIFGCAFVLSFGFLLIYYIDVNKENILNVRSSKIVLVLIPSICLFLLHCGNAEIVSCAIIVLLAVLSGCFNFTISSLTLFMLYMYAMLFGSVTVTPTIGTVLFIFAVLLFSRNVFTLKNSIYSALIVTVFYAVVLIIECDFDSSEIFTAYHLLLLLFGIVSILAVRFLVMALSGGFKGSSAIRFSIPDDAVSSTDTEASTPFYQDKDRGPKTAVDLDGFVPKEDLERLEERLSRVYKENDELQEKLAELSDKKSVLSISDICREEFMYLVRIRLSNPTVYEHSVNLARFAGGAAEAINCDAEIAYALGIIHDAAKVLGPDYREILSSKYSVPDYLLKPLNQMSIKNIDFPIMRETGIVMLANDMMNTFDFVTRNKSEIKKTGDDVDLSWPGIVKTTIRVRNTQNFLRYSGFSSEEVNTIKDYLISVGGEYYKSIGQS